MPRFGLWSEPVNWQHIFKSPEFYLENLRDDTEIELYFKYSMPLRQSSVKLPR
jgi:hypothetical protein